MTPQTSDVLLARIIAEYGLMVEQVEKTIIEDRHDLGWVSAFLAVSNQFYGLLSEFQVEVSPPPQLTGTELQPGIRHMVH